MRTGAIYNVLQSTLSKYLLLPTLIHLHYILVPILIMKVSECPNLLHIGIYMMMTLGEHFNKKTLVLILMKES